MREKKRVFILNISTGALTINTSVAACNQSYNITINVTDVSGAFDTADSTFNISNRGSSPEINAIYPYGNTSNNNTITIQIIPSTCSSIYHINRN